MAVVVLATATTTSFFGGGLYKKQITRMLACSDLQLAKQLDSQVDAVRIR